MRAKQTPKQMRPSEVRDHAALRVSCVLTRDGGRRPRPRPRRRRRTGDNRRRSTTLTLLSKTKNTKQVRNTAMSPEGLEEYMEFRAGTDLRWPYA
jgi:hypothetical protein